MKTKTVDIRYIETRKVQFLDGTEHYPEFYIRVKFTDMVQIFKGMDITVRFERPTALQIDGETVQGVTEYRAYSCRVNAAQAAEEKETTRSKAETKEPAAV